MRLLSVIALAALAAVGIPLVAEAGLVYGFVPNSGGPPLATIEFASPPAFSDHAWSTSDGAAILRVTLMPALFPGPSDLLPLAPVVVASGFNFVDPFQSLTGRDLSEGDVDAAFAYQVGSQLVDGSVVLQAAGGDGNIAIFRVDPSRGELNVMGHFSLVPGLGDTPVPGAPSVVLLAAGCLVLAASLMADRRARATGAIVLGELPPGT